MKKIFKYFTVLVSVLIGLGAAGAANANPTILINDSNGNLISYDTVTKGSTVISNTGRVMFDIALSSGGDLLGVNGGTLFKISPTSGVATVLGSLGGFVNGLVFGADGTLFGSGSDALYKIDPTNGQTSLVGAMGIQSAGDLAFFKGQLYLASNLGLATVDTITGAARLIGGTTDVFGLASTADGLFGVKDNNILSIDPTTGVGVSVATFAGGTGYGAGSVPVSNPTAVPEPATWAMLLLGLALVGYVLRRRGGAPTMTIA